MTWQENHEMGWDIEVPSDEQYALYFTGKW
jgi:hypothetical protein